MGLDSWLGIVGRAFRCRTVPSSQGSLQLGRGFRNGETPPSNRAFHKLESSRSRRPTHQWMAIFADNSQGSLLCAQFTLVHGHLLMTVSGRSAERMGSAGRSCLRASAMMRVANAGLACVAKTGGQAAGANPGSCASSRSRSRPPYTALRCPEQAKADDDLRESRSLKRRGSTFTKR